MSISRNVAILSAAGWRPTQGDTLTGAIVSIQRRTSDYGTYPCVVLEDDSNGEMVAVHAFHELLKAGLAELRPKVGQTITIAYLGRKDSAKVDANGKARSYENYVVLNGDGSTLPEIDDENAFED